MGIGRVFNVETLTVKKVCAVLTRYAFPPSSDQVDSSRRDTSFAGVLLVSASDSSESVASDEIAPHAILGDSLALISAVFYALYVILLKVRIKSESRIDMQLFFGFVGLFNILAYWPIGILLHVTGVETLEWPSSSKAITILIINVRLNLILIYSNSYLVSDGNNLVKRLLVCAFNVKDDPVGRYHWSQSYDPARGDWGPVPGPFSTRQSRVWSYYGLRWLPHSRHGQD